MNKTQAFKILGLDGTEDARTVKRKYRKLMHQMHPDSNGDDTNGQQAARINIAYELVMKDFDGPSPKAKRSSSSTTYKRADNSRRRSSASANWNVKQNPNAYCSRPIFHHVEDFDGNSIGTIEIARGKYVWSKDEDFSLFLKSLYETSKELLAGARPSLFFELPEVIKQKYLARLTYILTGQFIDSMLSLPNLAKAEGEAYKIDAMLELDDNAISPRAGTKLYPAGISNHRLYVRNKSGEIVGYLSFKDDRMYYVVIPLFEQRVAQVKMIVADKKLSTRTKKRYVDLDLWIKPKENEIYHIENTNIEIEELLKQYAAEGL
ncbi:MAG: DnaJ domain-containing protein [Pseudobutyrivibrio sp.]|nr:DnaJ domain-containing protein [Pseudobutyrivibrio sp.]